jgi:MFS family permease
MAIADGALQMLATFFFRETYGPVILERKAARLRKETGNLELHVPGENHERSLGKKLRVNLSRPFIILATHPMAQISTIYGSVGFGILYIVLSSFASLWTTLYQQSASVSGLHYFSIVAGFTIGSQGCSYLMDRIWAYVSRTRKATPELRAALMPPGAFCWVVGLFIYGWGAQNRLHWLVPDIGAALYGLGSQLVTSSSAAYMTDIYGRYTASAMAGSFCVRALFAFSFPLFAPQMYQSLGYGWGNSLLAFVCAAMGCTIPWVIWKYGAILRAKKSVQDLH